MSFFNFKQKLAHYSAVAKGEKPVKKNSKFSKKEQEAYARGQRDARNESVRAFAYKNATPEQRASYQAMREKQIQAYKTKNNK